MLTKIITGGQTGIDRISLEVAKDCGYETGGTAAKGWMTEKGPDLTLKEFGLVECEEEGYPARTLKNIEDSDGTIVFGNLLSPGSKLTCSDCSALDKPYTCNPTVEDMIGFIRDNNITVLNIAGNRGSRLSEENRIKYTQIITKALTLFKISHIVMDSMIKHMKDEE